MHFNEFVSNESALPAGLDFSPISQIGIIVPHLKKGVSYYRSFLNIKQWYRPEIKKFECYYLDNPIDLQVEIAVGYSGKIQIELIQVSGKDDNIYYAHLGREGYGFHHMGVTVKDLEKGIEEMKAAGFQPVQTGTLEFGRGGVTHFAYFDTTKSAGFIFELIETRAFGINLKMPEWLLSLGRFTGDTTSI